jgi:hypothetical protein
MLIIMLRWFLIIFGELFKEQEYLEELNHSHELLLLGDLSGLWWLSTYRHKLLVVLKFELFSRFQDVSYSDTLRLKLINDEESPLK